MRKVMFEHAKSKKKYSNEQLKAIRKNYAIKSSKKINTEGFDYNCGVYSIPANKIYDKNSTKEHIYLVYSDKNNNVKKVVETTHIIEPSVIEKVKKNLIKIVQLSGENYPTGVNRSYYVKDINNKPFNLKELSLKNSKLKPKDVKSVFDFATEVRK